MAVGPGLVEQRRLALDEGLAAVVLHTEHFEEVGLGARAERGLVHLAPRPGRHVVPAQDLHALACPVYAANHLGRPHEGTGHHCVAAGDGRGQCPVEGKDSGAGDVAGDQCLLPFRRRTYPARILEDDQPVALVVVVGAECGAELQRAGDCRRRACSGHALLGCLAEHRADFEEDVTQCSGRERPVGIPWLPWLAELAGERAGRVAEAVAVPACRLLVRVVVGKRPGARGLSLGGAGGDERERRDQRAIPGNARPGKVFGRPAVEFDAGHVEVGVRAVPGHQEVGVGDGHSHVVSRHLLKLLLVAWRRISRCRLMGPGCTSRTLAAAAGTRWSSRQ